MAKSICTAFCFTALLIILSVSVFPVVADNHTNHADDEGVETDIVICALFNDLGYPLHHYHFKPVIDIAVRKVNELVQSGAYVNFNLSYVWRKTDGSCGRPTIPAPGIAAKVYQEYGVAAFIGPPCSPETAAVADLSAFWNIPILSGVSTGSIMDDKARYPTFTRTSFQLTTMADFLAKIFTRFNWGVCAILWQNKIYWPLISNAFRERLDQDGVAITSVFIEDYEFDMRLALLAAVKRARSKFHLINNLF